MKNYIVTFKIEYFSGTTTGESITVESAAVDIAKFQAMNIIIDHIRKSDKSVNLKEIIIVQVNKATT